MNALSIKQLFNLLQGIRKYFSQTCIQQDVPVLVSIEGKQYAIVNIRPAYDGILGNHIVLEADAVEV